MRLGVYTPYARMPTFLVSCTELAGIACQVSVHTTHFRTSSWSPSLHARDFSVGSLHSTHFVAYTRSMPPKAVFPSLFSNIHCIHIFVSMTPCGSTLYSSFR